MRTIEIFFLAAVLFLAAIFAGISISRGGRALSSLVAEDSFVGGAAGQPRDVDQERILDLIRQGKLSNREADFYKDAPPTAKPEATPTPVPR